MKILIVQLARLGDIYQTWPIVRALHREAQARHELIEIDMITRDRFALATEGLKEVHEVFKIDSKEILSHIICDQPQVRNSVDALDSLIQKLKMKSYDQIINLSFSSFSSYLTEALTTDRTKVRGYSRYSDGFLNLTDDVSSYFLAQVGVGLFNRVHVTDLFSQVAGIDLLPVDYHLPKTHLIKKQIVIHVGASRAAKTLAPHQWAEIVKSLILKCSHDIYLIGSDDESAIAAQIAVQHPRVMNWVGRTELRELMELISESELLIGGDSAPTHIAALADTPVFNLSFQSVNFWETGPKSAGSRIFCIRNPIDVSTTELCHEILALLNSEPSALISVLGPCEPYDVPDCLKNSVGWELVQALYMQKDFPPTSESVYKQALMRLFEVNQLALEQIASIIKNPKNIAAAETLEHCDLIFKGIENLSPEAAVLVRWLRTEKLRIGPDAASEVLNNFQSLHLYMKQILEVYPLNHWYKLKNGVLNDKNILDEA
jgi:heptosyltransferase-3